MSIEQAAAAFDADMGNSQPRRMSSNPGEERKAAPEPIFGGSDVHDFTEEAGGDNAPAPKQVKRARDEQDDELDPRDPDDEQDDDFDPDEIPDDEDDELEGKKKDDDEDEDDEVLNKEYTVMVDGEETKVTLKEALRGYIGSETLHRRMNFIEQSRQAVVTEGRNVVALRQKVDEMLADVEQVVSSLIPAEPNWDELFAKDPAQARALQKQYDTLRSQVKAVTDKRAANQKALQDQSQQELAAYKATEARKFAGITKWGSRKDMEKDLSSMNRTAATAGFTPDEIKQVYDSRMLHVLLKASKYDRMMANKPKPVDVQNRQQKPQNHGAGRNNRTAPKGNGRAMEALRKTGSVEAAASVFRDMLNRS